MARSSVRTVVFDIETENIFQEVGSNDPTALDISIVGAYDSATDTYESYAVQELPKLWPVIEQADTLVGYNSDHFDIPLLNKYYPGDLTHIKSIDLMAEIRNVLGRRLKLDSVAEATLKVNKTGHGLEALEWWRNGEEEKVRKYCLDDVRITKELYEYMLKNKEVNYKDFGEVKTLKIDTSSWKKTDGNGAMTHTLPF